MKDEFTIEARVHSIRRTLRARQPLQQRVDLVRARHCAMLKRSAKPTAPRRIEIRLDGPR